MDVAPVRRGINAACYGLQPRPVATKKAGAGSPRLKNDMVARLRRVHVMAQRLLSPRCVLASLKCTTDPARVTSTEEGQGPSGKQKLMLLRGTDHPLSARPVCLRPRTRNLQSDGCESPEPKLTGFLQLCDFCLLAGL